MVEIYPAGFESKIGFDKIRDLLSQRCLSTLGKEIAAQFSFSSNYETIVRRLDETVEFMQIIAEETNFPTGYYLDVRPALQKIKVPGTFLEVHELFDLKRSLETIRAIVNFFRSREEAEFPRLRDVVRDVQLFPFVYDRIDQIISKHGTIKDNASPELANIRREIFSRQASVSKIMQSILRKAQKEGLVEKDVSTSIRDGRTVIPIAAGNKRKLKGIVHDESATGRTAYVEPEEVVEVNNRIRELESAEKREIVKILIHFTDEIRPYAEDLAFSYGILAELDFIRAKALWAIESESVKPKVTEKLELEWFKARHPLLERNLKVENRKIVPLDITLTEQNRILLISGPNAGGKSVCLKTVGLVQYMLQCGLPVPVSPDSRSGIFERMFIDIGDDQSLENDLSTYSSHLTNMKFFTKNCTPKTLVLIDEFGTGTEPMLGGSIAEAVLNRVNQLGTYGVITTHYTNLKHFASSAEGIENGAMLYDSHQMEPLFRLQIGKPGSSFAFEIARKIGLPEDILKEASDKIGQEHIDFDKHLRDIVRDKRYWEGKRQRIRKVERHLDDMAGKYESDLEETERMRKEILAKAKREADELLSNTNRMIERTIREIKEANAEKEQTRKVRRELDDFRDEVEKKATEDEEKIARKMEKLRQKEQKRREKSPRKEPEKKKVKPAQPKTPTLEVGAKVRLQGQQAAGEVLEINGKNIVVAFGALRSTVKRDKLEVVSNSQLKKEGVQKNKTIARINDAIADRKMTFKPEVDVRGMRAEEALHKIQEFIDEAIMVEAAELRILHGKGTGVLRELIRNYLRTEPMVRHYHDEHVQHGGAGITVVELA
ncbi:endonuclease MutS2 [Prolixibacter sp. NT017]|uniref:endonuclease MutS2 n=1 Tax=Prolixibacter sp. NT017 TaxID=2652390 RepID=UPI00126DACCF|nr:Smr/MutS family protein [Prolixibacter sp. NT017]GET26145.1 endonuclease MutS2 [Prolixibacter sp. NT017]